MTKNLRLFMAVRLPEHLHETIRKRQHSLASILGHKKIRWVPAGNHHVTILFLGSVPMANLDTVTGRMEETVAHFAPVHLVLGNEGWFAGRGQVRVIFRGLDGDVDRLAEISGVLRRSFEDMIAPDPKRFKAHITLGRVRRGSVLTTDRLRGALEELGAPEPVPWTADTIVLYSSQLQPGGPVYSPVHEIILK